MEEGPADDGYANANMEMGAAQAPEDPEVQRNTFSDYRSEIRNQELQFWKQQLTNNMLVFGIFNLIYIGCVHWGSKSTNKYT